MILQALTRYYDRLAADDEIAPPGFQRQEIPFVIQLQPDGQFAGVWDTRDGDGKKKRARAFRVPKAVKRTVAVAPNLLWDGTAYVLARPAPDKKKDYEKLVERAGVCHQAFIARIHEELADVLDDPGVAAVCQFLDRDDFTGLFAHALWPEIEETGANVSFALHGERQLVCQRPAVVKAITAQQTETGDAELLTCLVTGEHDVPARLHPAIKGVWGAQPAGANIVSFNQSSFISYGKAQGMNAPVGGRATFAYTTALNRLLGKDSNQRFQVADASTVCWADEQHPVESIFGGFFSPPPKGATLDDSEAVKALFAAPHTGAAPLDNDLTGFHVLGLAPNASRLAIRFWYTGTVGDVMRAVRQFFADCALAHSPKQPDHLPLFSLLATTALQGKAENITPNLAGEIMQAILRNSPFPVAALQGALRRMRAEQDIPYARAALIKAYLTRHDRQHNPNERAVTMSLDLENTNPGYRLGRLFATLERSQEAASPGLNATIRDRFFGAASATPVAVFPTLIKLNTHHLAKVANPGQTINLQRLIGEIIAGISDFPAHLSLADQGRFAIGYYHQRQDFFTKKTTAPAEDAIIQTTTN